MQHCTKVPLLLNNIHRYTVDPREQQLLSVSLLKLETSLRELDTLKTIFNKKKQKGPKAIYMQYSYRAQINSMHGYWHELLLNVR